MGSSTTKPKLTQVAPCQTSEESLPRNGMTWAVLSNTQEQERRRAGLLPPLQQEVPLTFSYGRDISESLTTAAGITGQAIPQRSIIQAHPPRRMKRLEPLALPQQERASQPQPSASPDLQDFKDGSGDVIQRTSTGKRRPNSEMARNQSGVLAAQSQMSRKMCKQRFSEKKRIKEIMNKRYQGKDQQMAVENGELEAAARLIKRPKERDIFWDSYCGEQVDLEELVCASPELPHHDQTRTSQQLSPASGEMKPDTSRSATKSAKRDEMVKNWMDWKTERKDMTLSDNFLESYWGETSENCLSKEVRRHRLEPENHVSMEFISESLRSAEKQQKLSHSKLLISSSFLEPDWNGMDNCGPKQPSRRRWPEQTKKKAGMITNLDKFSTDDI
ncbi:uncharacterized protein LOC120518925 isoform X1 [Polypterus senegalus]|uniref:uncharacterized protein LOC120518925 isoform X1 n=1 Tax=Polypterus senegalus TaxID=55291 RepID=UPI001966144D|nr:uncharacterized protein LOC120518925 isoform X1 [Polypterus senegalus]